VDAAAHCVGVIERVEERAHREQRARPSDHHEGKKQDEAEAKGFLQRSGIQ
jgi:hypothetical protein